MTLQYAYIENIFFKAQWERIGDVIRMDGIMKKQKVKSAAKAKLKELFGSELGEFDFLYREKRFKCIARKFDPNRIRVGI